MVTPTSGNREGNGGLSTIFPDADMISLQVPDSLSRIFRGSNSSF
jgi:hypothetical protein